MYTKVSRLIVSQWSTDQSLELHPLFQLEKNSALWRQHAKRIGRADVAVTSPLRWSLPARCILHVQGLVHIAVPSPDGWWYPWWFHCCRCKGPLLVTNASLGRSAKTRPRPAKCENIIRQCSLMQILPHKKQKKVDKIKELYLSGRDQWQDGSSTNEDPNVFSFLVFYLKAPFCQMHWV